MDQSSFDKLARLTAAGAGRRGVLRSGLAVILAGLGASSLLEAEARRGKRKGKGGKHKNKGKRCKPENSPCIKDKQCCPGKKNRVCDVPFGAGNSDKKCCPGAGHACTPPEGPGPHCCTGEAGRREFECVGGFCQECPGGLCEP